MERWKGKAAIVTGASAGIGTAVCEKLVEAGVNVAGFARRKTKVEELAVKLSGKPGKLYPVQADVRNEDDIIRGFQWVKEQLGPIHILVNNAGVSRYTDLLSGDTKLWREVFDTNVMGLCMATREAIKDMRQNKVNGHIVHINSVQGHKVGRYPVINVYPASKHAVTALTETLRQELNGINSKIKVSSISPGAVRTEIVDASGAPEDLKQQFKTMPGLNPEDVADAIIYVLGTPPHVQVHELIIKPVGELE